jgi:hypothetical protein
MSAGLSFLLIYRISVISFCLYNYQNTIISIIRCFFCVIPSLTRHLYNKYKSVQMTIKVCENLSCCDSSGGILPVHVLLMCTRLSLSKQNTLASALKAIKARPYTLKLVFLLLFFSLKFVINIYLISVSFIKHFLLSYYIILNFLLLLKKA